jgi:hypothetical protein
LSLTEKIYNILKDGLPHRSDHITRTLFGTDDTARTGLFRLGARIWDVKQKYGVEINGWHDKENPKLYWYQIVYEKLDDPDFDNLMKDFRPEIGNTRHAEIIKLRAQMATADNKRWFRQKILSLI